MRTGSSPAKLAESGLEGVASWSWLNGDESADSLFGLNLRKWGFSHVFTAVKSDVCV